jgi:hypothetical protein
MLKATPGIKDRKFSLQQIGLGLLLGACVILVNLLCFGRSLGGYFLADDFVHVAYLHQAIDNGHFDLIFRNFTGNWMQAEGTSFYRPLITITLVSDYLLGGGSALAFHLSNLIFQIIISILLGLSVGSITRHFTGKSNFLPALASAIIFSAWPAHCEVVSWIIARVDSVALLFFMLAFYTYLEKREHHWLTLPSILSFILALMSKEMAIILPPLIFIFALLSAKALNKQALKAAFVESLPYFVILAGYLLFRLLVLGTVTGGYQGSIGEGLSSSFVSRFFSGSSLSKFLLPLNLEVFGHRHSLGSNLKLLYVTGLAIFFLSLGLTKEKKAFLKETLFYTLWLLLALAPTYQVFNLTDTLQGSRFIYFSTAPLACLLGFFLFGHLSTRLASGQLPRLFQKSFLLLRYAVFAWLCLVLVLICQKDNLPWIKAMKEVRTFKEAVEQELKAQNPEHNLCILNIPQSYQGSHMLYNAATMSVLFCPPLAAQNLNSRIFTFEPATFGDSDLLNRSRFADLLKDKKNHFAVWDRKKYKLNPLKFKASQTDLSSLNLLKTPTPLNKGEELLFANLNINPLDYDLLTVSSDGDNLKPNDLSLKLQNEKHTIILNGTVEGKELVFHLSEHKSFYSLGQIETISLLSGARNSVLAAVRLARLIEQPLLEADKELIVTSDGIARPAGKNPTFKFDASHITGAKNVYFEFSKVNSWFEHYTGSLRSKLKSPQAGLTGTINGVHGKQIAVTFAGLKSHGFFQLRIAAVDANGKILGYFSDPLNFQL